MGWLSDLVGQSNIDAAKKAYNSSRFNKTVNDVAEGLGSLKDTAVEAWDDVQEYKASNAQKIKDGNAWWQDDVEGPKTQYEAMVEADQPLQDQSLNALIVGKGLGNMQIAANPKVLQVPKGDITKGLGHYSPTGGAVVNRRPANKVAEEFNRQAASNANAIKHVGNQQRARQELANRGHDATKVRSDLEQAALEEMIRRKNAADQLFYGGQRGL